MAPYLWHPMLTQIYGTLFVAPYVDLDLWHPICSTLCWPRSMAPYLWHPMLTQIYDTLFVAPYVDPDLWHPICGTLCHHEAILSWTKNICIIYESSLQSASRALQKLASLRPDYNLQLFQLIYYVCNSFKMYASHLICNQDPWVKCLQKESLQITTLFHH